MKAPAPTSGGAQLVTESRFDAVGNRVAQIDANGQVTTYAFDQRNQLQEQDESPSVWTDPAATPSPKIATVYQYDNLGKLSRVTRASGDPTYERATDYTWDGLDRLRKEIQYPGWPSTGSTLVTQYSYDGNGNETSLLDPLSQTTAFGFDALNRLTSVSYSDGQTPNVTYSYDADGNRISMVDGTGSTTYSYDELGMLTAVVSPGAVAVGYRWDMDGNRTKLTYPDSTAVSYSFDKADHLQALVDWANRTTSYAYFPDGHLQTASNVNGTTTSYSYDTDQRLTQVLNRFPSGATISQHTYTLDNIGNRTQRDETPTQVGGGSMSPTNAYSLDRLYRLTGDGTNAYSYDPVGNRTSSNGITETYDRADRTVTAGTTVNANGNLIASGSNSFAYDQANRLTRSTVGGVTTTYV